MSVSTEQNLEEENNPSDTVAIRCSVVLNFHPDYPLIHIITVRYPAKFSFKPVELPATIRAEMRSRRRTRHGDILHKILLIAFRTTVPFHAVSCESPWE